MISRLHLLRYVERTSVLHRADARTKVAALVAMVFAFSFNPGWVSVAIVWATLVLGLLLGRLPAGVIPKPPKALLAAMGVSMTFGLLSGGEPFVTLADNDIGLGGIILQTRLFAVTLGLLGLALLLGWTTKAADLPRAADWLLSPLRRLGIPTDDVIAALTLAVRALPLIADEVATVIAMARTEPKTADGIIGRGMGILATATVASVRRAGEFGTAIESRGMIRIPRTPGSWTGADLVVVAIAATITTGLVLAPS